MSECTVCFGGGRAWFDLYDADCPHCNGTGIEPEAKPEESEGEKDV